MIAWLRRSDVIYLGLLSVVAFLLLYFTAKPIASYGESLSVYSSGKTGIRALYLLSKKLGYKPVIHRQSPVLVPKGAKAVFSQRWTGGADSTGLLRASIEKALRRGLKLVYLAPITSEAFLSQEQKKKHEKGGEANGQREAEVRKNHGAGSAYIELPPEASKTNQPKPHKVKENHGKAIANGKSATSNSRKIFELEWRVDREGVTISTANYGDTHKYLRDVNLLKSQTVAINELHSLSAWEKRLGEMDEVYVLEGTVKPILGVMRQGEGELIAVFAPHFLTNQEIGMADNVVFAHNLIVPEGKHQAGKEKGLYFLTSMFGLRSLPIGVTGIFFFTAGGRIALFLLVVVMGFFIPRIFAIGRDYRVDEDRFPSPNEKIMALSTMLQNQKLFKESFRAGLLFLNPRLNFATEHEFSNFLVSELGIRENEARRAANLLFSKAKPSPSEKQELIKIYRRILTIYKPRRLY